MPELIESPSRIEAAGTKPKLIEEFVGRVNTGEERLSVARMRSPAGWVEPGQRPEFDEWTLVLDGCLHGEHQSGALDVRAGQAVLVRAGEWVRYSTPEERGVRRRVPAGVRAGHGPPRPRLSRQYSGSCVFGKRGNLPTAGVPRLRWRLTSLRRMSSDGRARPLAATNAESQVTNFGSALQW